jgi:hypothetical protein
MPSAAKIAAAPVIAALRLRFLMVSPRWVVACCDLVTSECLGVAVRRLRNPEGPPQHGREPGHRVHSVRSERFDVCCIAGG